jgi:hypothetical protein
MSSNEYREFLALYGDSQRGVARLLGVNEKTSRNWARYGVTGTAAIILRLFYWGKVLPRDLSDAATGIRDKIGK